MRNFIKDHRFLAGLLSVFISVFLVSIVAYAATTIGTNIETAGTATMESASTTNDFWLGNVIADDDDSLFFDASGTEWLMWDDSPGEFDLSDALNIDGGATSTFVWIGSGGTANNIDMSNDLYVQGDAEIDGILYGNWASSTSATTTDYLYVGPDGTEDIFDFSGGDIYVAGDAEIEGSLTLGGGSEITKALFGSCTVDLADTLTAGEASSTDCTATGVAASDTIFITPDWLEPGIVFQAASSTTNVIRVHVYNASTTDVTTAANTWRWMAIR